MHTTRPPLGFVLALLSSLIAACHAARPTLLAPPGHVVVDASATIRTIAPDQLGANLGVWYNVTAPNLESQLAQIGPHLLRWPGGSVADVYHREEQTECNGKSPQPAYDPRSTFPNFLSQQVVRGNHSIALTVAYGTNTQCTGGGDPKEAAAWVAYVRQHGYGPRVKFWTVGNESYGNWEADMHAQPHDPAAYAAAMSGVDGYYALMKSADPAARVGVIVAAGFSKPWDSFVLTHSPYDFVEMHWYAQQPAKEDDHFLLYDAPSDFAESIAAVREELVAAGKPGTPIIVGEMNSVGYNPGKQSVSIVNALFTGQVLAEGLESGVAAEVWWFGDGGTQACGNNNSPSLYGFQDWGSYDLVFGNTTYSYSNCARGPTVPEGTVSPSGEGFKMVSEFIANGGIMLPTASGSPDVRAYAVSHRTGYSLLLFNLSATSSEHMQVAINHAAASTYTETDLVYGKAQYDQTRDNLWPGPASRTLRGVGNAFAVTLPAWSISLIQLQR